LLHVNDVIVADAVKMGGTYPRLHVRGDHLQDLGRQAAGYPHLLDIGRGLDGHVHGRIIH
jgi:hypothetical protein